MGAGGLGGERNRGECGQQREPAGENDACTRGFHGRDFGRGSSRDTSSISHVQLALLPEGAEREKNKGEEFVGVCGGGESRGGVDATKRGNPTEFAAILCVGASRRKPIRPVLSWNRDSDPAIGRPPILQPSPDSAWTDVTKQFALPGVRRAHLRRHGQQPMGSGRHHPIGRGPIHYGSS